MVLITSVTILLNYAVSTLLLTNYFYPSISTPKTLWPNHQAKLLLTHGIFENEGWKPVRGGFHGCGTITLKEVLIRKYSVTLYPFCEWQIRYVSKGTCLKCLSPLGKFFSPPQVRVCWKKPGSQWRSMTSLSHTDAAR